MTKLDPTKRLTLIKRSIEITQNQLGAKLFEMTQMINKKQISVRVFESYFSEYNKGLQTKSAVNVVNFMNQQRFLNQIAQVLMKEREGVESLQLKKDKLLKEFAENAQKIDVISQNLAFHSKNKMLLNEKLVEQINLECFENSANIRAELFAPK